MPQTTTSPSPLYFLHQLDAFLRTTEGLQLQDNVYTWLVKKFSSCPRPHNTNKAGKKNNRKKTNANKTSGSRQPKSKEATENDSSGENFGVVDLCLTRDGFIEMYMCIWQAAGRDLKVKRSCFFKKGMSKSWKRAYFVKQGKLLELNTTLRVRFGSYGQSD